MRLGRKKKAVTGDETSTSTTDSAGVPAKPISSRRNLGSRVKGLFKGRSTRKSASVEKNNTSVGANASFVGDDKSSDDVASDADEDAPPSSMSHPAAGLTHEMLGIPEEEEEDDPNVRKFGKGSGRGSKGSGRGNLDSRDPMDQLSPMEGGVDDKYLGGNYDDLTDLDENSIVVVLLLIDPTTLRFELLQLEFDARIAKVSDALAQIPESATEMTVKSQPYKGVIDVKLRMQSDKTLLKDFAKTKDLLVAVAASLNFEQASRLARPILSDEKVVTMLRGNGFDVSAWTKDDDKARSLKARNTNSGGKSWKYARPFQMVGYLFLCSMLAYILSNIQIHGLDELIQHTRESMKSDWRFASGSKFSMLQQKVYDSLVQGIGKQ